MLFEQYFLVLINTLKLVLNAFFFLLSCICAQDRFDKLCLMFFYWFLQFVLMLCRCTVCMCLDSPVIVVGCSRCYNAFCSISIADTRSLFFSFVLIIEPLLINNYLWVTSLLYDWKFTHKLSAKSKNRMERTTLFKSVLKGFKVIIESLRINWFSYSLVYILRPVKFWKI